MEISVYVKLCLWGLVVIRICLPVHLLKIIISFKSSIFWNSWRFNNHFCFNFEKHFLAILGQTLCVAFTFFGGLSLQINTCEPSWKILSIYNLDTTLLHASIYIFTHSTLNTTYRGYVLTEEHRKKIIATMIAPVSVLRVKDFKHFYITTKQNLSMNIVSPFFFTYSWPLLLILRNNYIEYCIFTYFLCVKFISRWGIIPLLTSYAFLS